MSNYCCFLATTIKPPIANNITPNILNMIYASLLLDSSLNIIGTPLFSATSFNVYLV